MDTADPVSIQAATERLVAEKSTLNVLINNAGIMPFDDAAVPMDDTQAQLIITTNLLGPIRMTSALIEHLKAQPLAVIVNSTSVMDYTPLTTTAVYSASKAELHSYTLFQRFMLRNSSITVQEIAPPWLNTDLIKKGADPRTMPRAWAGDGLQQQHRRESDSGPINSDGSAGGRTTPGVSAPISGARPPPWPDSLPGQLMSGVPAYGLCRRGAD